MTIQLSVFTVATPELAPEELAAAARKAGLQGIEWRCKDTPEDIRQEMPSFWGNNLATVPQRADAGVLARFRSAAEKEGLKSISLTPYLQAGDLEGTEQVLAAARELGADYIRLGVHGYDRSRPFGELFGLQRIYLREASGLCRQYGVKGLIETHHGTIAPSASAAIRLCEGLDSDAVGVLYDPGNMVHEGYENHRMGMEMLGPYLAHVHMKNAGWTSTADADGSVRWNSGWTGMKAGVVRWKEVVSDLIAVGYDGFIGVEDFSGQYSSPEMLEQYSRYMRELLETSGAASGA